MDPSGGANDFAAMYREPYTGTVSSTTRKWMLTVFVSLLAALLVAWMYISPYRAVSNLRQTALEGNIDGLRDAVDFPALRTSLKEEFAGKISKHAIGEIKQHNNGFGALGTVLAGGIVNAAIDQFVTPQIIASMAQGENVAGAPAALGGEIQRFAGKTKEQGGEASVTVSSGYEAFDRFCVRIFPQKSKAPVTLVLSRSGLANWRLTAIRIPDLDELAKANEVTEIPKNPASSFPPLHQKDNGGNASDARGCLSYNPAILTLTGTISPKTFPGPPNYESIEKGDEAETYWVLTLNTPICTVQQQERDEYLMAETNVRDLQLSIDYDKYRTLLGQSVIVSGTLDHAVTGHHHTPVMMSADSIRQ